jgi:aspartyl-tRNA(Asn)/glutamyl-tRNA(Gln) amidotransferase subunit A
MTTDEGPLTISDAAKRIRSGELTPSSLLELCLARIDRYEPKVKAWVYMDRERARREADQLTKEFKDGLDRGPLHGIPIGVKDIIDVFDMPTGCGSKLWANSYARRDATCVERLRQAGALILGKTVTTAFAYLDPPVTRNPWNLDRTPGGSSSGSAAAVACGMCLGALGTQTGGSIIRPAAYCGVYSMKPRHGWANTDGILPLAPSLDHLGFMANCVDDLELFYRALSEDGNDHLCEADGRDSTPSVGLCHIIPDSPAIHYFSLTQNYFFERTDPKTRKPILDLIAAIADGSNPGIHFYEQTLHPGFNSIPNAHRIIMATEAATIHRSRFSRHRDDYPPKISELIEDGLRTTGTAVTECNKLKRTVWESYDIHDTDKNLIVPATLGPPPGVETTGDPQFNSPWSFLGMPVVGLPIGWDENGLPISVQIVNPTKNARVLRAAKVLEGLVNFKRRPVPSAAAS